MISIRWINSIEARNLKLALNVD